MSYLNYQRAIKRTIPADMERKDRLAMFCMGLSGEQGEVVDHVKKHLFQGHTLDVEQIKDEAGDVLWYFTNLLSEVGLTIEEVQEHNIDKLYARYPNGFDAEKSVNRKENNPNIKKVPMWDIAGQINNFLEYTKDWDCKKCKQFNTPKCLYAECFKISTTKQNYAGICGNYDEEATVKEK